MPRDDFYGLLKRRLIIDAPSQQMLEPILKLQAHGFLDVQQQQYVRCVNPLDRDQQYVRNHNCNGRTYLSSEVDEEDYGYQCSDCERVIFPKKKNKYECLELNPVPSAIKEYVHNLMRKLGCEIEEKPIGILRARTDSGEVQVCFIDWCRDPAALSSGYTHAATTIYLVLDDRTYGRSVPKDAESFRLVDLVLTDAHKRFQRRLRQIAKLDDSVSGPAVLTASMPIPSPMPSPATPARGQNNIPLIPVPTGTGWSQIQFYLIDGETVAITVPGSKMSRYGHIDLGMAHKRHRTKTKLWELLQDLCESSGHIHWSGTEKQFSAMKERVSKLRSLLQSIFNINDDPFPDFGKNNGLKSAFQAFPDLPDEPYVGENEW